VTGLIAVVSVTGCTGGTAPKVAAKPKAAGAETAFIECMRAHGVEITDPIPGDTSGRSALKYELDVNGRGNDPAFQAAIEQCQSLLPPAPPPSPPAPGDVDQRRKYAQCMRDHGIADFPDPNPDGSWPPYWLTQDSDRSAATAACAPLNPGPSS
jgi:hypothetical protein